MSRSLFLNQFALSYQFSIEIHRIFHLKLVFNQNLTSFGLLSKLRSYFLKMHIFVAGNENDFKPLFIFKQTIE